MSYLVYSIVAIGLSAILGIASFAVYLCNVRRKYSHIPCPAMDNFFLGHLPSVMKYGDNGGIFFHLAVKWYKECGPIFVFYLIGTPIIVTINPEDVKKLLNNKNIKKSPMLYHRFATVLGARYTNDSLMAVEGKIWEKFRMNYNPAFKKGHLIDFLPIINKSVQDSLVRIKAHADIGTLLDMKNELHLVTMSSISKIMFNKDLTPITWSSEELQLTGTTKSEWRLDEVLYFASDGSLKTLTNPFYEYTHPTAVKHYHEAARAVRRIVTNCVQERLTALEQGQEIPEDLLSYVLALLYVDPSVTAETLIDNVVFLISGGYQNTSSLLSSILLEILSRPAVLSKIVKEINDVMGERSEVTNEDLQKFIYMNQVVKETLRIHPPLVGLMREAPAGYSLSGHDIPRNTSVMMSNFLACRVEQNFTDPLTFDPDRFASDQETKPNPYVYFPFGNGPRYCIGKYMAIMQVKTILAGLVRNFKFQLAQVPDNIELVFHGLIAEPTNDLHCYVKYQ